MKCEHAQDFFSEYMEQSLDKPSVVALEAHLTACGSCRRGLEGFQQTWESLKAVPTVEPPKDLAWRVMVQLQQERLERLEAERKRPNPILAWLQGLTPGAAFGYALLAAILFVGIAFPLRAGFQIPFGYGTNRNVPTLTGPSAPAITPLSSAMSAPEVSVYHAQPAQDGRYYFPVEIVAPSEPAESRVIISPLVTLNGQLSGTQGNEYPVVANQRLEIQIPAIVSEGRVQGVSVYAEGSGLRSAPKVALVPRSSQ